MLELIIAIVISFFKLYTLTDIYRRWQAGCPHYDEPLRNHHDGCPSCWLESQEREA